MPEWSCMPCGLKPGDYQDQFIRDHKHNCLVYQAAMKAARLAAEAAAEKARLEAETAKKSRKAKK
jgi:hypothetical protein